LHDAVSAPPCSGLLGAWHGRCSVPGQETSMTDLIIVALTLALFATAAGFVRLCERM
jgi:hypothetical protein